MIPEEHPKRIPDGILTRLKKLDAEIAAIVAEAKRNIETEIPRRIAFDFRVVARDGDLMTAYERAQSISFVTRYDNLPDDVKTHVGERDGKWCITNLWVLRHVLSDFRPLIHNQNDAVHYNRVHRSWYKMLQRTDTKEGMVVRALSDDQNDITPTYSKWLIENKRAISTVMNRLEFAYLYNGVLQHSDPTTRSVFLPTTLRAN